MNWVLISQPPRGVVPRCQLLLVIALACFSSPPALAATLGGQQAYIKALNTQAGDGFGSAVALSGGTAALGIWGDDSTASGVNGDQSDNSRPNVGAAYLFVRTGTAWTQEAYMKPANPLTCSEFGSSVLVLDSTRILIGARSERSSSKGINGDAFNFGALQSGAAYLFARDVSGWRQAAYLKASNTEAYDSFGVSIGGSERTLLVGASGEDSAAIGPGGDPSDNSAPGAGAAYVFTITSLPDLSITRAGNDTLVVSWPSPSTGWNLQQNTAPTGGTWTVPPEAVNDDGTNRSITIHPGPGQRFFRLERL